MNSRKRIAVVSVINDLVSDYRVKKIAETLAETNFQVTVIGRVLPDSPALPPSSHNMVRLRLFFKKGPLFYFFFQLRLFMKLLATRADLLYANDLDTLLPNYLVSRIKRIPLIYDSHEIFCEVPELQKNKTKKAIWEKLEAYLVPKIKHRITVNKSIADYFQNKYNTPFNVVRNIPPLNMVNSPAGRAELGLPPDKFILIMQGAGINIDRGAEELISAMALLENALLLIIGSGDVWPVLQELSAKVGEHKVRLIKRVPKNELIQYTRNADLGISIDKDTNLNYRYSLPNKLFDYIHCGLPVLVSRLPEIEAIVNTYQVGEFIPDHRPVSIAAAVNKIRDGGKLNAYKLNTAKAAAELTWTSEKEVLKSVILRAAEESQVAIN